MLIQGETGTGKGLVASLLHQTSSRARAAFVDVNCAAIPESLLESELFGYERGAFTDARRSKPGLFQEAHRGTLFLDEVGLLPLALQAKLLTVLEARAVRRLGATQTEAVDVWIVSASNADLAAEVRARRFREDLFHRLAVVRIEMPPLRERREDIALLAEHILEDAPRRAAHAALAVLKAFTRARQHDPELSAPRIAIHSGRALVGYVGDTARLAQDSKLALTTILDSLVDAAVPGEVVVSGSTAASLERRFALEPRVASEPPATRDLSSIRLRAKRTRVVGNAQSLRRAKPGDGDSPGSRRRGARRERPGDRARRGTRRRQVTLDLGVHARTQSPVVAGDRGELRRRWADALPSRGRAAPRVFRRGFPAAGHADQDGSRQGAHLAR